MNYIYIKEELAEKIIDMEFIPAVKIVRDQGGLVLPLLMARNIVKNIQADLFDRVVLENHRRDYKVSTEWGEMPDRV